jgi:hypothetical protein
VDIPIIVAGKMQPDVADASIKAGKIDAVGIARQLLCDGEYLTKLKEGREDEIRPCIACHNACLPVAYYKNSGSVMDVKDAATQGHCALNPVAFEEKKYALKPAAAPKKIAVIGGGIAGMQVALLLSQRGHTVDLYEKTDKLGGVFIAAAAPSFKEKDKELLAWYRLQMDRSKVNVHMNTTVNALDEIQADEYIIATGATARKLPVPGFDKGIEDIEYLNGIKEVGETVAVIGGGLTGCEIAYDLALKGKKPIVVEMTDDLVKAAGICAANSTCLRDLLRYHKADIRLESTLKEIEQAEKDFYDALEPLKGQNIDVAMFPVDPRQGSLYDAGANHFIMTMKPRVFIPMHWQERPEIAIEFARRGKTNNTEVLAMVKPGTMANMSFTEEMLNIHVQEPPKDLSELPPTPMRRLSPNFLDGDDPFQDTDLPVDFQ